MDINWKPRTLLAIGCVLLALAILLPHLMPLSDKVQGLLYGVACGSLLGAVLRSRMPDPCDTAPPALRRRYLREFVPAMAGYVVLLILSLWLLKRVHDPALRAVLAVLPVLPIALVVRAMMRFIRDTDELQRQIELEAVSMATALVSLLYMAGGFMQLAKVIDIPSGVAMIWVFPLVCMVYGLAKIAVGRRFR
jgi:hypothetical protein